MKKRLNLLIMMLLPMVAVNALAQLVAIGNISYSLSEETVKVVSCNEFGNGAIEIPSTVSYGGKDYSVTTIGGFAFFECTKLKSIVIPNGVTTIEQRAFEGCTGLTSLIIPNSVTTIEAQAFQGCTGLTSVVMSDNVQNIGSDAFYACRNLASINIPNSLTSISDRTFHNCNSLASLTIPTSVTSIGNGAFAFCKSLPSLTIPQTVANIGMSAFLGCSGLTSMTVEEGNEKYDSRDNCNAIIETSTNKLITGCKNTVIPTSVTSLEGSAFSYCSGLTSIAIPNSVTKIGSSAFSDCSALTSITLPNSVTSLDDYTFLYCTSLASITIPQSVTTIGEGVFYNCSGLASITVEEGNPEFDSRNDCNAIIETSTNELIAGCKNTKIPTSVTRLGESAFGGCSDLASIVIPSSVERIMDKCFEECYNLVDVYCYPENAPHALSWNIFDDYTYDNATLHVPEGKENAYGKELPWRFFSNVVALTDSDPKPTGIKTIEKDVLTKERIYDLSGRRLTELQTGVNIIQTSNGKTKKVLVK